jgi:hypothetical protein
MEAFCSLRPGWALLGAYLYSRRRRAAPVLVTPMRRNISVTVCGWTSIVDELFDVARQEPPAAADAYVADFAIAYERLKLVARNAERLLQIVG